MDLQLLLFALTVFPFAKLLSTAARSAAQLHDQDFWKQTPGC